MRRWGLVVAAILIAAAVIYFGHNPSNPGWSLFEPGFKHQVMHSDCAQLQSLRPQVRKDALGVLEVIDRRIREQC